MRPSGGRPFWQRGDVMNWRYRRRDYVPGAPELVLPVRVICDDDTGLAVWVAEGTPMWTVERADGRRLRDVPIAERFLGERVHGRGSWLGPGSCGSRPRAPPWSVWWFRSPFTDRWEHWNPPQDWDVPALPTL